MKGKSGLAAAVCLCLLLSGRGAWTSALADTSLQLSSETSETLSVPQSSDEGNGAAATAAEEIAEQISEETSIETQMITWDAGEETTGVQESILSVDNMVSSEMLSAGADGNIVIVLDPGHDASHTGAAANGLNEYELNLIVAQYCKEALEAYSGVTVYLTRTTNNCPYPGTTSGTDNAYRVDYAASVGADAYVALHFNSAVSTSAKGVSVYYPNANYNAQVGNNGKALAEAMQEKLVELGLNDRGILLRNSEDNTCYPDGSLADYYGVIKRAKEKGFPGVIVEHAFLTNSEDAAYVSNEANLKKLGIADAEGIAAYFGLKKTVAFTASALKATAKDAESGTITVTLTGLEPAEQVSEVQFAVWSNDSNRIWYTAVKQSDGSYSATIALSAHGNLYDTYYIHTYVTATNGYCTYVNGIAYTLPQPSATETPATETSTTETPATETPLTVYYGDVNGNGAVEATDALRVLRHVVALSILQEDLTLTLADINHSGTIDASDALQILQVTVGLLAAEVYEAPAGNVTETPAAETEAAESEAPSEDVTETPTAESEAPSEDVSETEATESEAPSEDATELSAADSMARMSAA